MPPTLEAENVNSRASICSVAVWFREVESTENILLQQVWLSLLSFFNMSRLHEPGVRPKSTKHSMTVTIL